MTSENYESLDLEGMEPDAVQRVQARILNLMEDSLDRIALSLERQEESLVRTTVMQPESEQPKLLPTSELPAAATPEEMTLPDGRKVPTKFVQALTEYDQSVWPGALLPEARAAVASVILREIQGSTPAPLSTNYPFCLDDPEGDIPDNDSPCIRRSDHDGRHLDNNDGTW